MLFMPKASLKAYVAKGYMLSVVTTKQYSVAFDNIQGLLKLPDTSFII